MNWHIHGIAGNTSVLQNIIYSNVSNVQIASEGLGTFTYFLLLPFIDRPLSFH
jgi:hypothetical protein